MKDLIKQSFWMALVVAVLAGTFMGTKAPETDKQEKGLPPFITTKHSFSLGIEIGIFTDRHAGAHYGISVAPIRYSKGSLYGIAIALVNLPQGIWTGSKSSSETVTGLQLGIYNQAEAGKGVVQIGLWNVIRLPDGKKRSTPIINLSFPR
jgi:hypothetical protein